MEKKWTMPLWMEKWVPMIGVDSVEALEEVVNTRWDKKTEYQSEIRAKIEVIEQMHDKRII